MKHHTNEYLAQRERLNQIREQVMADIKAGMNSNQIAVKYGINASTVRRWRSQA